MYKYNYLMLINILLIGETFSQFDNMELLIP